MSRIVVTIGWLCLQSGASVKSFSPIFHDSVENRHLKAQNPAINHLDSGLNSRKPFDLIPHPRHFFTTEVNSSNLKLEKSKNSNWVKRIEERKQSVSARVAIKDIDLQFNRELGSAFSSRGSKDQTTDLHQQTLQVRAVQRRRKKGLGLINKLQTLWGGIRDWSTGTKTKGLNSKDVPQTQFNVNKATASGPKSSSGSINTLERGLAQDRTDRRNREPQSGDSIRTSQMYTEHLRTENNQRDSETPYERGRSRWAMSELGSFTYQDNVEPLEAAELRSKLGSYQETKKHTKKPANSGTTGPNRTNSSSDRGLSRSNSSSTPWNTGSESVNSNRSSDASGRPRTTTSSGDGTGDIDMSSRSTASSRSTDSAESVGGMARASMFARRGIKRPRPGA